MLWVLKEPSQLDRSLEHPKHMLKMNGKTNLTINDEKFVYLNLC